MPVVLGLWGRLQSRAVALGILYLIVWVLILPDFPHWAGSFGTAVVVSASALVALILVEAGLHWLRVFTVALPMAVGIGFLVVGSALWLASPLLFLAPSVAAGALATLFSGAGTALVTGLSTFTDRVANTFQALGGAAMWLAHQGRGVNELAVGIYLFGIGALGVIVGVTNLSGLVLFLGVWLLVYGRLSGDLTGSDLRRVFQLVATLAIVAHSALTWGAWSLGQSVAQASRVGPFGFPIPGASPATGPSAWPAVYTTLLSVALLLGVWRPLAVWARVPASWRSWLVNHVWRLWAHGSVR